MKDLITVIVWIAVMGIIYVTANVLMLFGLNEFICYLIPIGVVAWICNLYDRVQRQQELIQDLLMQNANLKNYMSDFLTKDEIFNIEYNGILSTNTYSI